MNEQLLQRIISIISNPVHSEREVLYQLRHVLYETEVERNLINESKDIRLLLNEDIDLIQNGTKQQLMIPTGFADFDKFFGGFAYGELVVLGGRPGMGKTLLLVNMTLNISVKIPVLYFTLDISETSLSYRFLSSASRIPLQRLLQNELTEEERTGLNSVMERMDSLQIFVNDSSNNSISALRLQCVKHINENGVRVIIIDYLQLMTSNRYRSSREQELCYICQELKSLAKEYNVCVIATSQLSRAVESRINSKKPMLSDLRESGGIEQSADKVMFLFRPDYYGFATLEDGSSSEYAAELILAKNRNGAIGEILLSRDVGFTNFSDAVSSTMNFNFFKNRLDEINDEDVF